MALGSVGSMAVSLTANTRDFDQKMDRSTSKLTAFESATAKMGEAVTKYAKVAALAATAAVVGFGVSAVKTFVEFDTGMREVFTLMPELSAAAKEQMTADVKDIAEEIAVLPTDVIPALYQAISAGVPKENVFAFLEIAGKASIAGVTELSVAVDGLTSVTNAYGEEVIDAQEVADIMFTAVKRGKTTFEELSARMFQAVPIASKVGLSFKNVAGAAAQITLAGVPMRVAMTQIRALLNEVAFEGKELNKVFTEAAGVSFQEYIAAGGDIAGIIEILQGAAAAAGVSVAELTANLEAQQAMLNLSGVALGNLRDILDEMSDATGAADAAYEEMAAGIQYQLNELKVWWQNLKLDIGEDLAGQLQTLLLWLKEHQEEIGDRIKAIFDGIIDGLEWLSRNGKTVKIALLAVAAGFTAIWVAANPLTAAIIAITGAISLFVAQMPSFEADVVGLGGAFADASGQVGLLDLALAGLLKPAGEVRDILAPITGTVRATASTIEELENHVWLLNTSLDNMVDAEMLSADAAAKLKERIAELRSDLIGVPDLAEAMQHWPEAINAILNTAVEDFPQLQKLLYETAEVADKTADQVTTTTSTMAAEMAVDISHMMGQWWTWSGELSAADRAWLANLKATHTEAIATWEALQTSIASELAEIEGGYEQTWEDVKNTVAGALGDMLNDFAGYRWTRQAEEKAHHERIAAIREEYAGRSARDLNTALEEEEAAYRESRTTIGDILKSTVVDLLGSLREQLLLKAAAHLVDALALAFVPGMQAAAAGHLKAAGIYGVGGAGLAIAGFQEGGRVSGQRGEPQIAVVHGHEWILTPEQREGLRIDYRMIGAAVETGVYEAMTDALRGMPSRPIVLQMDRREMARGLFNGILEENDRRGGVIVTA